MAGEGVPWMINGARHPGEVGRRMAWAATKGERGVIQPTDCKVRALVTPGAFVVVNPGGIAIRNTYPGGSGQSYLIHIGTTINVPIAATGGSARTDYVIARISDPQYAGAIPADPENGPYWWIETVPSITGLTYPFELLASVTIPANTATITGAMITDRRRIAMARTDFTDLDHPVVAADAQTLTATSDYPAGGTTWPLSAERDWQTVDIPDWAVYAKIRLDWSGVKSPPGNAWGWVWVQLAPTVNPDNRKTQGTFYDTTGNTTTARIHLMAADTIYIPPALRGTAQKIYPRGNVNSGSQSAGRLHIDGGTTLDLSIKWLEMPD
jgi:hypothetical protein